MLLNFSWFGTRSTDRYASKNWRGSLTLISLIFYSSQLEALYMDFFKHWLYIVLNQHNNYSWHKSLLCKIWERCACLQTTIHNLKIYLTKTNDFNLVKNYRNLTQSLYITKLSWTWRLIQHRCSIYLIRSLSSALSFNSSFLASVFPW